jgi:hypothetical protein
MVVERRTRRHRRYLQGFSSSGLAPVDHLGDPQVFLRLEPDAIGHPALLPQGNCDLDRLRSWWRGETRCPVRYLATLLGATDEHTMRWFILVVALLLDPTAMVLLLAATGQ